jgi:hypothetical protein
VRVPSPAKLQARYYLITGIWPLVSRRSFETVTGRKHDFWLVRTVGLLAASNGVGLYRGTSADARPSNDIRAAAICAAIAFAAVDLFEVTRGRIRSVYLVDAAAEAALLAAWWRELAAGD